MLDPRSRQTLPEIDAAVLRGAAALPGRILVVDDCVEAAELVARALSALGYETRVAADGPSALAAAAELDPDLVLVDIGMPVMDGYELAARLRATARARPTLVAVTGYTQLDPRAERVAFDDHVVKPVDLDALEALVRRLLPH